MNTNQQRHRYGLGVGQPDTVKRLWLANTSSEIQAILMEYAKSLLDENATLRARMKDFVRYAANDFVSNRDGKTDEYKKLFDESLAEIRNVEPDFDPFIACIGVRSSQEATAHLINSINSTPTTVLGWLQRLPDGYRERAIGQFDHVFAESSCSEYGQPKEITHAIEGFAIWETTNEGEDFWRAVYHHYKLNEPLPPLPI
jgi:hypothetical protein